jgi:hypothetical protein
MKTAYLHFADGLFNRVTNGRDKCRIVSLAAGMAASATVGIPSAAVENVQQYYNLSVMPLAQSLVEETNENLVMEFEEGMNYTLMFWRLRYFAAHPAKTLDRASPYGFFDTVLGANLYVDQDSHSFANQYKKEIFELRDALVDVYEKTLSDNYVR